MVLSAKKSISRTWCHAKNAFPLGPLHFYLRVLCVLRGQAFCHHEEHEGHEVWITRRAKMGASHRNHFFAIRRWKLYGWNNRCHW